VINELTDKTPILRFQAGNDILFTSNLLSCFLTQSSFSLMESLSKTANRGSVLLGLLASFFTLLQLEGEIVGTLVSLGESLWRKETKQQSR
jgi:hypothetical protein